METYSVGIAEKPGNPVLAELFQYAMYEFGMERVEYLVSRASPLIGLTVPFVVTKLSADEAKCFVHICGEFFLRTRIVKGPFDFPTVSILDRSLPGNELLEGDPE